MFENLLESKRKKERSAAGAMASVIFHGAAIAMAIVATANAGMEVIEELRQEKVDFVEVKKEEPPPEVKPPPPDKVFQTPPPKGFQVLTAPISIPDVLPQIDLSKKMTDAADFTGRGVAGGTSTGVVGGVPQPVNTEQTFYEFQVEKPAAAAPNNPAPVYPEFLKNGGVEGTVLAQFVIDTMGRADMSTFKILQATHDQFSAAVRAVLPRYRFIPAEVGGRKVKQVVQLPFSFSIR